MSKRLPSSRLDSFFSELEQVESQAPQNAPVNQPFWTWEANEDGVCIGCGPEVQDGLGISPIEWIGQPIFSFAIHSRSIPKIKEALRRKEYPLELDLNFSDSQGKLVEIRMNIFRRTTQDGQEEGWRGFNQVLSRLPAIVPPRSKTRTGRLIPPKIDPAPGQLPGNSLLEAGIAWQNGQTRAANHPWTEAGKESLAKNELVSGSDPGSETALAVPFQVNDQTRGIIEILDEDDQRRWSEDDLQLAQDIARQLALALENAQLYATVQKELGERIKAEDEAQRRALELQTAAEIARDTTGTLAIDELLDRMVNLLKERFEFYHVQIFLLDEPGNYAVVHESSGAVGKELKRRGHKLAVGSRSVIGATTASGDMVVVPDASHSDIFAPNPLLPATRSEIGLPLKAGDQVIGALDIQYDRVNAFTPDDLTVMKILADQIAVAIENARAYELSQKAYEEIKEVDRVKSQFLANMSHELRTPLNSIIGFSRVILKGIDGSINETQKQDLSAIYSSGQHLLTLINNILDLSKIEAGKMELQITEVNLDDLINSVMSTAVGLVKDKPVHLHHEVEPGLPPVNADQTRVRQILLNFVSNAAKFTEEGTITVTASRVTAPDGKLEVMVTIADTGSGIASEDQPKLFQPFSQVDGSPTRKTGGTGLGLSICRSMVEMQGGRIGLLDSEIGKGSTFYFTLPVTQPEEQQDESPPDENLILAIDDDDQVINLYQRYLKPQGYRVIALTNPLESIDRVIRLKPAMITLDIMMPGIDGWQVLEKLKSHPETRDIPVIVCSIQEEEERARNLGAADYLVKPFLQEDLVNSIHKFKKA